MLQEIGKRRIGLASAIVSLEFISKFVSTTYDSSEKLKQFLQDALRIEYLVMVLGDKYAIRAVKEISDNSIDQDLARVLMFSSSELYQNAGLELLSHAEGSLEPYKVLLKEELLPLWNIILSPSSDKIA